MQLNWKASIAEKYKIIEDKMDEEIFNDFYVTYQHFQEQIRHRDTKQTRATLLIG